MLKRNVLAKLNISVFKSNVILGGTGHRRDSTMAALLTSMVLLFTKDIVKYKQTNQIIEVFENNMREKKSVNLDILK